MRLARLRGPARRVAIAAALALALGASSAQAAPLSMSFTEARANVGVQLSDAALFAAPNTAPLAAQINPATGAITAGSLEVPDFQTHITDPVDADVTVHFAIGTITGSFTSGSRSPPRRPTAPSARSTRQPASSPTRPPPATPAPTASPSGPPPPAAPHPR